MPEAKRKRSGKQREEAKLAAIAAAAAAERGEQIEEAPVEEPPVEAENEESLVVVDERAVAEDGEEAGAEPADGEAPPSKKRKRTGKMREEAKRLAIQRRLEAEGAEASAAGDAGKEEKKAEGVDVAKVAERIPTALKKLHPVFKQAKREETMRLIKKIRFLKTKGNTSEVAELETQLKFLSVIQLNAVATTHLRQKLRKHHVFKHAGLPDAVTSALPQTPSVAASSSTSPEVIAKVENRLCSAKHVADAVKPTLAWILAEPGATLSFGAKAEPKKKRRYEESESEDEGSMGDAESGDEEPVLALQSDDEVVMQDKAADEAGWESGDLDGEEGEDDGWESGSVDGEGYDIAPPSDSDESIAAPPSSDDAPPPKKAKPTKEVKKEVKKEVTEDRKLKKAEKVPPKATGSSMFLPSLAAGFTAGDSDSDPDMDYDPTGTIGSKAPPRKNRRGQRARQAIWEKKYGKNAKHVVKAREAEVRGPQGQVRDGGWGARRGADGAEPSSEAAPPRPASRAPARVAASAAPRPAASAPSAPPAKTDDKVHPSWEAARARKAREMAIKDAPKATKIVFD